ncbi:hypothetical protein Acr_11g0005520 [Actinidia rufa]|uniref:Phorbol-ester/DAG-type domain-containing protein n=1 Tax=Actinidia rufa TaxID=165716 RepID=A0A7J0FCT0_9ERIC|nr:hypothetical protein Acr_11g0005520 [Actinidia rufa]
MQKPDQIAIVIRRRPFNIRGQYQHVAEMDVQKQLLEMDMEEQAMRDVHEQLMHPIVDAPDNHNNEGSSLHRQDHDSPICRIAATQLSLRIRVVIDSPLTSQVHRDRLVHLAESTRARLITVECRPRDEYEWRQCLERRAMADQSYKPSTWGDLQEMLGKVGSVGGSRDESLAMSRLKAKQSKQERGRYKHLHTLGLSKEGKHTEGTCNICSELVSGQAYDCDECEFILHKFCAELSDKVQRLPDECPPFLRAIPPVHTFPEKHVCDACIDAKKGFLDECYDCLFLTHLKCKLLPTILHHECHEHPLRIAIILLNSNFEFICRACGHFGKGIAYDYSCGRCRLHFHVSCLLLPCTLEHRTHRTLLLSITFLQMMVRVSITAMLVREKENQATGSTTVQIMNLLLT